MALSQLSYGPAGRSVADPPGGFAFARPGAGNTVSMPEKTDYSAVVEERGEAERRRGRRFAGALFLGAHTFWIYALVIAGIVLLVVYLAG